MATKIINNIKLGIFATAGLVLLILGLYIIGKNSNLFGHNFHLKAHFENVQGLTAGNNVRYAGIQVGTVKKVRILSDTLIEVTMLIEEKMKPFIHQNDLASIGTDGLMGNKLINIIPAKDNAALVHENDILPARQGADTEAMLETLNRTNNTIALISEDLQLTVHRINSSKALWGILDDATLPENLKSSLVNIRKATGRADEFATDLHTIISDIKQGKGSLGAILTDTAIAINLKEAIERIESVGDHANELANELTGFTQSIRNEVNNGKGTLNALLKDSTLALKVNNTLTNIEQGTSSFNQSMEALKHNFLLRGYFRKQEKQRKKETVAWQQ